MCGGEEPRAVTEAEDSGAVDWLQCALGDGCSGAVGGWYHTACAPPDASALVSWRCAACVDSAAGSSFTGAPPAPPPLVRMSSAAALLCGCLGLQRAPDAAAAAPPPAPAALSAAMAARLQAGEPASLRPWSTASPRRATSAALRRQTRVEVPAAVAAASGGAAALDAVTHGTALAAADQAVLGPAADLLRAVGEVLTRDEAAHALHFALPGVLLALPAVPVRCRSAGSTDALWRLFDAGVPVGGGSSNVVVTSERVVSAVTMTAVTLPTRVWVANALVVLAGGTPTMLRTESALQPSWASLVCARGIVAGLQDTAADELATLFSIEALSGRASAVVGAGDECAGLPPYAASFVRRAGAACALPSGDGGTSQPVVHRAVLGVAPPGVAASRLASLLRVYAGVGAEVQPALSVLVPGCLGASPPRGFFALAAAALPQPASSAAAAAAAASPLDVACRAHVDTALRLLLSFGVAGASSAQELVAAVCGGGGGDGGGGITTAVGTVGVVAGSSVQLHTAPPRKGRGRMPRRVAEVPPEAQAFMLRAGVRSLADFRRRVIAAASAGATDSAFVAALVGVNLRVSDYRLAVTDEDARKATRLRSDAQRGGLPVDQSFVAALAPYTRAGWAKYEMRISVRGAVTHLRVLLISPLQMLMIRSHPGMGDVAVLDATFGICVHGLQFFPLVFIHPITQHALIIAFYVRLANAAAMADGEADKGEMTAALAQMQDWFFDMSGRSFKVLLVDRCAASLASAARAVVARWARSFSSAAFMYR
jgi:hypothetical protein